MFSMYSFFTQSTIFVFPVVKQTTEMKFNVVHGKRNFRVKINKEAKLS